MTTEDEIRALLAHIEETAELLLAARGDPNGVRDGSNGRVVDTPRSSTTRGHSAGEASCATSCAAQDPADAAQDVPGAMCAGPG
jgi:hypothetical protein